MDVIQLHYFRTIVEQGSLNKAAEALYISRQGLTKIIRKMEQELVRSCLTVTGTGMLTPTRIQRKPCMNVRKNYIHFIKVFK